MEKDRTDTSRHLTQWYGGDIKGLEALLERHLPWLHAQVKKRLGPMLRSKGETWDYVQDAMVQFLKYAPPVQLSEDGKFRALILKIIENGLRDKHDWYTAKRRAIAKERPLPSDTVLSLDPPRGQNKSPSMSVDRHEREAWIRLGMELLEPDDREILFQRLWNELSYQEMGEHYRISEDAARMRYSRSLAKLAEKVGALRRGQFDRAVGEDTSEG